MGGIELRFGDFLLSSLGLLKDANLHVLRLLCQKKERLAASSCKIEATLFVKMYSCRLSTIYLESFTAPKRWPGNGCHACRALCLQ